MKRLVLILITILSLVPAFAQNNSNLTICTTGNSNLKITFGGKKYSLQDRSVTFQSLSAGSYSLTIFQLQRKADGRQEYVNVFDRTITLTSGKHLEIAVLRFGKTQWDESYIETDDWNQDYENPRPVSEREDDDYSRERPVSQSRFLAIKKTIADEYNEEERLKVCQLAMKNNLFTTAQIREICMTFYSEEKKLMAAKNFYDFCYDKGNYITLGDMFYGNSLRRQLMEFISTK